MQYREVGFRRGTFESHTEIQQLISEGWELVCVTAYGSGGNFYAYFKK